MSWSCLSVWRRRRCSQNTCAVHTTRGAGHAHKDMHYAFSASDSRTLVDEERSHTSNRWVPCRCFVCGSSLSLTSSQSLSLSSYPSSSSSCRCIARAPLVTRRLAIEKERRKRKDLENLDLRATDQRFRRRLGSRSDGSSRCTSQAAAAAAAAATRVTRGLPPLLLLLSPVTAVE